MHFAGADATRANLDAFGSSGRLDALPLQVGIPTAIGEIMRVADGVAVTWSLATDFAAFCHDVILTHKSLQAPGVAHRRFQALSCLQT